MTTLPPQPAPPPAPAAKVATPMLDSLSPVAIECVCARSDEGWTLYQPERLRIGRFRGITLQRDDFFQGLPPSGDDCDARCLTWVWLKQEAAVRVRAAFEGKD